MATSRYIECDARAIHHLPPTYDLGDHGSTHYIHWSDTPAKYDLSIFRIRSSLKSDIGMAESSCTKYVTKLQAVVEQAQCNAL